MDDQPPTASRWSWAKPMRIVLLDTETWCDCCLGTIHTGEPIHATPGDPPRIVHDGGCPAPWVPVVIDGGGEPGPGGQLTLPLLTAVEEDRRV